MAFEAKEVIFYPDPEPALDLDTGGGRNGGGRCSGELSQKNNVIFLDDYRSKT